MNFIISLIAAIALVAIGRNFIKKHANLCYVITTIISVLLVVGYSTGKIWTIQSPILLIIALMLMKSAFATALFVVVMFTGAFKNGGKLIKFLMPIRAELSIIASILTLAHNISFGQQHFVALFTAPETMAHNYIAASIVSLILIAIMIPLFITSFPSIRKKMKPKMWKKLQKLAYVFYGLIYVHVMLLMVPAFIQGRSMYLVSIIAYTVVFGTYAIMRIRKHSSRKSAKKSVAA